jgi:hypothetical protein
MTSKLVSDFWAEMNRHENASYRKLSDNIVLECEMWVPDGEDTRGRIIAWESDEELSKESGVRWNKAYGFYGPFSLCQLLYEQATSVTDLRQRIDDSMADSEDSQLIEA